MLKDDDLLEQIGNDWRSAPLGPRRHAMLEYVEKLTVSPSTVSGADVDALRAVGFDDRDVLEIAEVTAYYAYVNRIADGLGVELESASPDEARGPASS